MFLTEWEFAQPAESARYRENLQIIRDLESAMWSEGD